ncbi:MAG: hypothetical protein HYY86_02960 [Candidatus Harrisonbacteria bacterium]|nr:hypothetical protein [Candidatus Harrisonbacteria bacterium]
MAIQMDLKKISLIRIEGAKILLDKGDYQGSAYMMGLALECALKATVCKTLRIPTYPEDYNADKKVPDFFMTHSFVRLLLVSGLTDIFSASSNNVKAFDNWSFFTIQYPGEWVSMRYRLDQFEQDLTEELYQCLYFDENSIIKVIEYQNRW